MKNATVNLGQVGSDITGYTVSISGCTGSSCGSGCTSLVTTQQVSSFPKQITNIPDNVVSLFVKVDNGPCAGTTQCISITQTTTPTPTPTISATITPTLTPTQSVTPTFTITPTLQSIQITNCVRLTKDDAITGTENCNLDRVQRHEVTLYDSDGANIQIAPYDITVTLSGTEAGQPTTWTFIIPNGQSSVYEDIITREFTGVCGSRTGQINRFVSGISAVSPTNINVCTPAPTPTAGVTLNRVYYGQGLSTSTDHCGTNYSISASFFSSATTISGLFNQTIYTTDTGTQAFNGLSLWYPVSFDTGTNTETGGYYVIKINSNGYVEDLAFIGSGCSSAPF